MAPVAKKSRCGDAQRWIADGETADRTRLFANSRRMSGVFLGSAVSCLMIRVHDEVHLQAAEATTAEAFSKEDDVDARGRSVRALALQEA